MSDWWQADFQTTVDAYYRGDLQAGRDACERLLSVAKLPAEIEEYTLRNLVFYAPLLAELAPSFAPRPIEIPVPEGWSLFNPSVAADPEGDGLHMVVRSSNYTVTPRLDYAVSDDDGVFRTTNSLLTLSPQLEIEGVQAIDDLAVRPEPPPFPVSGFEDCRLFHQCGSWWLSATVRDRNERGICQMALVQLDGVTAREPILLSDGIARHEKNWMPAPVSAGGELRFIDCCYPTVVVRYDDVSQRVAQEVVETAPPVARQFSGGSQLIPFDDGRLCLIHEAANFDDGSRHYLHRWVAFDADWRLTRLSPPFSFQNRGVEFAAGLARHGDELVVSYGLQDREAWLATVSVAEVHALLAPPLNSDEVEAEMRRAALSVVAAPDTVEPVSTLAADDTPSVSRTDQRDALASGITPFGLKRPTIVSMTLTGNSEAIVGDALRSVVDWVDWCLVVDTGITDQTLEIAHQIAGEKLVVRQFPWVDDFGAARNFALLAAAETGADWAVVLDADERIVPGDEDLRIALATTGGDALHVKHVAGTYGKERFFRLPARGRYAGPTHEAYLADGVPGSTLAGVLFDEVAKSAEEYRRKAERDVAVLSRHTAEHPDDPRWYYYLGDSLAGLGRNDEAIAAFRLCASLNGWDEEDGWAMYRAAECYLRLDRPGDAVDACAAGLARHAGLAELSWLAAYASWQAGRPAQATYWARQSIAMGNFAGAGASVPRVGFRHPPALWEGPYDVLRFSLRATGDADGADEAERLFEAAKEAREAELGEP